MVPVWPICFVFIGCCSNVIFLELIITEQPTSGNLITFSQFLFIAVEGLIFTTRFFHAKRIIPIVCYVKLTIMHSINAFCQTVLLHIQVDIPLQQLLRSGSLIANLVLGVLMLKRSYKWSKFLSVGLITLGLSMATLASANLMNHKHMSEDPDGADIPGNLTNWIIGILVLVFALYISALMGIYQEIVYGKYGKHASECLFYCHALPLPVFLFLSRDIWNHVYLFSQSAPVELPYLPFSLPQLWLYMIGNIFSQYICIVGIYKMTAEFTSLTVTLVVTLRKFISLVISIVYFENSFTMFHWIGTVFVFGGTLLFVDDIFLLVQTLLQGTTKKKR